MKFILIRHGRTRGNLEHRYMGCRTDEPLCTEGIAELNNLVSRAEAGEKPRYPAADRLFSSPMQRCLQTAAILYPGMTPETVYDLRECDFGDFGGRCYDELKNEPAYQAWLDSGGRLAFPGGEDRASFSSRCAAAFEALRRSLPDGCYAVVAHGGTIMAIMERYARPQGDYYDFQVKNAGGYVLHDDGSYEVL